MSESQTTLFGTDEARAFDASSTAGPGLLVARVAMERGIDKLLDYTVPAKLQGDVKVGQRVRVPLGRNNKLAPGYVAALTDQSRHAKLKPLAAIVDRRTLLTPALMQLALWISRYYFTPFGLVLENMIPSAVKRQIGVKSVRVVRTLWSADQIQAAIEKSRAKKRRAILARILQLPASESIELNRLAMECDVRPAAVLPLVKAGVLALSREDSYAFQSHAGELPGLTGEPATRPVPNADQQAAIDAIIAAVANGFSVHLLFGVTGSGKTEVYLRAIDHVVKQGKAAIVLVPEIALTPQTVRRFTQRFDHVAVMHSGLTSTERHKQWQSITDGKAQVIVGARSGIFANVPNLGLIVVDEEHESSYKQDQAPRYHARDVAIKRGQLEGVPVVLGTATPSLEVWARAGGKGRGARGEEEARNEEAQNNAGEAASALSLAPRPSSLAPPYRLLTLPRRVSDRALPAVEIIDMKDANRGRTGIHLLSPRLEQLLKHTLDAKQQAILLLNRRGYSNFIYCSSCQEAVCCKYCDKTMTYHRGVDLKPLDRTAAGQAHAGQMLCHYCLAVNTLPSVCPLCGKRLSLFGLGTQRVEEELIQKFPAMKFARVDSDTMRGGRSYEDLLAKFGSGDIQVLMGTQMLAKGLDFPNVTLVGVINGDTALSLPDFRAGERTFQLLTQVAGRAGRGEKPGRVLVQTFNPEDETIRAAVTQDYVSFATRELEARRAVDLPPFARQTRIVIRDEDPVVASERAEKLAGEIRDAIATSGEPVQMRNDGPMPAAVGKIAGYVRLQILLSSPTAGAIQRVLSSLRTHKALVSNDRIAIDVDPISLL